MDKPKNKNDDAPRVSSSRPPIILPPWLDKLSIQAAKFPWWVLIIAIGLAALFYSFATSNLYRRVLAFVTDNPQITTNRYARVGYDVKAADGSTKTVRGTIIAQDDNTVTVETTREVQDTILRQDIGKLTCAAPDASGNCPVGQPVSVERVSISGHLILEDLGKYQLVSDAGDTVNILKVSVADRPNPQPTESKKMETRTPPECKANPEGTCEIALQLIPGTDGNKFNELMLIDSTADAVVVQTIPPQVEVLNRSDILTQRDYEPEQCALNNLAGCNEGPFLTLGVTFGAFFLACLIGLTFGMMRISGNWVLNNIATVYVEVIRGVPLLVILLFFNFAFAPWFRDQFPGLAPTFSAWIIGIAVLIALYFMVRGRLQNLPLEELMQPVIVIAVITAIVIAIIAYFAANSTLNAVQRAIIGLAFGYGAFLAELFRAGIQSVGKGQMEAARSLGMSYVQAMRYVILPQAFRVVLPPLGNEFIAILKDTSLIAVIAVAELTQKARLFASATYQVFPSYITIGALYLCMTLFLSFLVRTVERRLSMNR
ncbi:MAG: amino acid ABC transporter permease [Anaerolineae bacterium]|nr:amino acid ABC transporter permease [Anaerolineae bacterium]